MSMFPVDGIATLFNNVLVRVFPDKSQELKQQFDIAFKQLEQEGQIAQAQIQVNTVEAAHEDLFVSGARPFILWVCGFIFAYQYLFLPFALIIMSLNGIDTTKLPMLNLDEIWPVLGGLLGLGAYRSYEKVKGVKK